MAAVMPRSQMAEGVSNVENVVALMLGELEKLSNAGSLSSGRGQSHKARKKILVPDEPVWMVKEREETAKKKESKKKHKANTLAAIQDTEKRWSQHVRVEKHQPRTKRHSAAVRNFPRSRGKWRCQDPDPIDQKVLQDKQQETWLSKRHLGGGTINAKEKLMFRQWFNSIDIDGDGFLSIEEIADPLISTGVAKSAKAVQDFVQSIDINGDGHIEREELLRIYASKKSDHMLRRMLHTLEDAITVSGKGHALSENLAMSIARRKCLMDAVMVDRASITQREKQLAEQRKKAIRNKDQKLIAANTEQMSKFKRQRSQRLVHDEALSGLLTKSKRQLEPQPPAR
jgi:hypothetical protein